MIQRVVVLMDPIESADPKKDSSLALMQAAAARGHPLLYLTASDLDLDRDGPLLHARPLALRFDPDFAYDLGPRETIRPCTGDVILARKDPPVDGNFLHDTQVLDAAERAGALVVNRPQALRDGNEKLATLAFPEFCPPTLVSRDRRRLRDFVREQGDCVGKVLDGMGGRSIFRLRDEDPNVPVILETLTADGRDFAMVQRHLPEIADGDKRVLLIAGKPAPFLLARLPREGEFRGNLARGGRGEVRPLSEVERRIAEAVGPSLLAQGLWFVGLDVIGDRLTEINVTSPTCIREIAAGSGYDAAAALIEALEAHVGN